MGLGAVRRNIKSIVETKMKAERAPPKQKSHRRLVSSVLSCLEDELEAAACELVVKVRHPFVRDT